MTNEVRWEIHWQEEGILGNSERMKGTTGRDTEEETLEEMPRKTLRKKQVRAQGGN